MRSVLLVLMLMSFSVPVLAQQEGVRFYRIIQTDEEGKQLLMPYFVYVDTMRSELYVIDSKHRIIVYNSMLYPVLTLDKRYGIDSPVALTVDSDGNLYVIQSPTESRSEYRISIFNRAGFWQKDIVLKGQMGDIVFKPYRIAVNNRGDIYVVGMGFKGVLILDRDGELKMVLSPVERAKKVVISDIKMDTEGRIYLVSIRDSRIFVYDRDNQFLFKFGEKGGVTGKLSQPKTVGIDVKRQRIYIVDYMRHTVSVYHRLTGKFLFEFGGQGWTAGWFQFPNYIDVDAEGRVYVADTFNQRVQVFKPVKHEKQ